jgi:WD40 repeat protein
MSDNTLKIWDWSTNTIRFNLKWSPTGSSNIHSNLKFLSNGLLAAPGNTSSTIFIWDIATGQVIFSLPVNLQVYGLEQLSNGNLISSGTDTSIRVWNVTTGQVVFKFNTGKLHYNFKQTNIANYVASACRENSIYIWDTNVFRAVFVLTGHMNEVYFLDLTPSGLLVSTSQDNTLKLWNVTSSTSALSSISLPALPTCVKLLWSNQIAVSYATNYIRVYNISSSNVLSQAGQVSLLTNSQVNDMRLTKENILVLCQQDGYVIFVDVNTLIIQQVIMPVYPLVPIFNLDLMG